jgi:hypothetical protein
MREDIIWLVAYWQGAHDALLRLMEECELGDQGLAEVEKVLDAVRWRLEEAQRRRMLVLWGGVSSEREDRGVRGPA